MRSDSRKIVTMLMASAATMVLCAVAVACPTCKDNMAHDPASANLVRGYAYSIMFMLSMPPLIFGSLCAYFYWEVRKARAKQSQAPLPAGAKV